jgi:hypothetical protein
MLAAARVSAGNVGAGKVSHNWLQRESFSGTKQVVREKLDHCFREQLNTRDQVSFSNISSRRIYW